MSPPFSRFAASAVATGFALALAGCGQSQPEPFVRDADAAVVSQFVSKGQTLSAPITQTASPAPRFSVLALPPGAIRGGGKLTEKQYANGWRQSVALDTVNMAGGWNDLSIEIAGDTPPDNQTVFKPNVLRIYKPTAEGVRREILSRFKGVPMRIVGRPMQNAFGPFGLAIGAGRGGLRCAFAWQWVSNLPSAARGEKSTFFNAGEMPASIRMRLCRSGVTADQLAEWFEQLQIADVDALQRVLEAIRRNNDAAMASSAGASPVVSSASDSLEATLMSGPQGVSDGVGASAAPRRRAGHKRRAAAPAANETPTFEPPASSVPLTTPFSPGADGRQYLAPPTSSGAAPGVNHGVVYNAPRPDATLPAQAFRGPSGSRAITPPASGGAPVYLGPTPQ